MRYISLDTETGGIGLDKSLLTLGMVLADDKLNEIDYFQLAIKPDNQVYQVTARGLEINKINLVEHDKVAITENAAKTALYNLLTQWSERGKIKLIPIGKQIDGDINHIWNKLISRNTWEQFVSYRRIEVSSIFLLMQSMGYVPADNKGSLASIAEHYQMDTSMLHNALGDARLTLLLYQKMVSDLSSL